LARTLGPGFGLARLKPSRYISENVTSRLCSEREGAFVPLDTNRMAIRHGSRAASVNPIVALRYE
jgi:hypothetical protein